MINLTNRILLSPNTSFEKKKKVFFNSDLYGFENVSEYGIKKNLVKPSIRSIILSGKNKLKNYSIFQLQNVHLKELPSLIGEYIDEKEHSPEEMKEYLKGQEELSEKFHLFEVMDFTGRFPVLWPKDRNKVHNTYEDSQIVQKFQSGEEVSGITLIHRIGGELDHIYGFYKNQNHDNRLGESKREKYPDWEMIPLFERS